MADTTTSTTDADSSRQRAFDAVLRALAQAPAVRPTDLDLTGRTIGRYSVVRRIGQGGMGVVYEARDTVLGRKVALKVLHASERKSGATRSSLLEEARRLATLQHPSIATVYDAGEHDGIVFVALERASGQSLRQRLALTPALGLRRVATILQAIASGLACAHQEGIVHRDLKPENVVVDESGAVKIIDFGIATITGSGASPAGTRKYMAPEQAHGDEVSARADIFAFGILARELLDAACIRAQDRGAHLALRRLASACASADPLARPENGAALVEALDAILTPEGGRKRRWLMWPAAAMAAAGWLVMRAPSSPPKEPVSALEPASRPRMSARRLESWDIAPPRGPALASPRSADKPLWLLQETPSGPVPPSAPAEGRERREEGIAAPDTMLPANSGQASRRDAERVPGFWDEQGNLVLQLGAQGAGPLPVRGGALGGAAAWGRKVEVNVLHTDNKGGAIIEITLPRPNGADSTAPGSGKPVTSSGGLLMPGSKVARDAPSHDGPALLEGVKPYGDPATGLPAYGGGAEAPSHHFFCADVKLEGIHVIADAGGRLTVTAGDEDDEDVLAVIDASGEVVETAEGVTLCDARGEPLITFDG